MKVAKLFKNGQSQAVRLPKEFRFEGTQVFIKRVGNAVLLLPEQNSWQGLFDSLSLFSDDFMEVREQPEQQDREEIFE
ncbi:MAG: AbrB/MazE/SpoVT family DNA-binding domain-containing protein [Chloroflexi bacterium]|jgi:antitoxin VapB|nr:AbrB/MazE/SpoVT family DNA-binding domain-containing protein [Chloroflexota bacterium]